jgi:hypothetical protein
MKTLIRCLVSVVVLLGAVPARSIETEKTPQEIENLAKELVPELGNPDYQEREAVSQELVNLGLSALKALEEGRQNPDPEIKTRCELLSQMIRTIDLKRRIDLLANDKEGRSANTLPLAAAYFKICGRDENARKFYFELSKNNQQLLDDAANNPKTMGESYYELTDEFVKRGNPFFIQGVWPAGTDFVEEGAALFLIGAADEIAPSIDEANRMQPNRVKYQPLIGVLAQPQYLSAMIDPNNGRYFRKLLYAWAKRNANYRTMKVLLYYINTEAANLQNDPDTLEFVLDLAVSTSAQQEPFTKAEAMMAVANIYKNDQIQYFEEKLFKDETTLLAETQVELNGPTKISVETHVCDYALAICVNLSGQSFNDYGFDILSLRSDLFSSFQYAGFSKVETRKAAFKKYEEWRKANPIKKN